MKKEKKPVKLLLMLNNILISAQLIIYKNINLFPSIWIFIAQIKNIIAKYISKKLHLIRP